MLSLKSWLRRLSPKAPPKEKLTVPAPAAPPMERPAPRHRMEIGWATDIGRQRTLNEDSVLIVEIWQDGHPRASSLGLLVLADGMGGHLSGEIASALAVQAVAEHIIRLCWRMFSHGEHSAEEPSLQELLTEAFQKAQEVVSERVPGGGTTLLCALLLDHQAYIANVGDSRAYLISPDGWRQITRDHSIVDIMVELGQMTPNEAAHHPQRNVLYRAVGQKGPLEVDTFVCHIPQEGVLLLCSDGLWEMVTEQEILETVITSPSLQVACDTLVDKANQAGGTDNISVIIAAPSETRRRI